MKFQDGELRYLCVGKTEIIRRIYFAVRDSRWDTAMPVFTRIDVRRDAGGFTIALAATCRNDLADYRWQATITGSDDGSITFEVAGAADADFASPRIGLCVLYGADAVRGRAFRVSHGDDHETAGQFPHQITRSLIARDYRRLTYAAGAGLHVVTEIEGAHFDMEDQRNYGDSSYKAYAPLPYADRHVPAGARRSQRLFIRVTGNCPPSATVRTTRIEIGEPLAGTVLPALSATTAPQPLGHFLAVTRDLQPEAGAVEWTFNPSAHLPDDDTFMENIAVLQDQASTLLALAPGASLRLASAGIDSPYPRPARDPRNATAFIAAWTVCVVAAAARAGIQAVAFNTGDSFGALALQSLLPYCGKALLATGIRAPYPAPVDALAVLDSHLPVLWVANRTSQPQAVTVGGLQGGPFRALRRIVQGAAGEPTVCEETTAVHEGEVALTLTPFEICCIRQIGALYPNDAPPPTDTDWHRWEHGSPDP